MYVVDGMVDLLVFCLLFIEELLLSALLTYHDEDIYWASERYGGLVL